MARVLHDALHADELDTSYAEVSHQLFGVRWTEIRFLHQLLLLVSEFKRQVIFRQLLGFKWFLQTSPADGTEGQALLLNLDKTDLAEGVSAVKIAWHKCFSVEVLVARGAFHFNF